MKEYGPDSLWYYFERIIGQKAICKVPPCCKKILYLNTTNQRMETFALSQHLNRIHPDLNNQREKAKKEVEEQRKMAEKEKFFDRAIPEMIQGL